MVAQMKIEQQKVTAALFKGGEAAAGGAGEHVDVQGGNRKRVANVVRLHTDIEGDFGS